MNNSIKKTPKTNRHTKCLGSTPKTNWHCKFLAVFFFVSLAIFLGSYAAFAASPWATSDWSGSAYSSKHALVNNGSAIALSTVAGSVTHTTYNDFYAGGSGAASQTDINGSAAPSNSASGSLSLSEESMFFGVSAGSWGSSHGLKSDGTIWAWGNNCQGNYGNGTTSTSHIPINVSGLSGVTAISAGRCFTLVLKSDGTVWSMGFNSYGQLGNGTTVSQSTPVQVTGLTGVTAISAGDDHSLALKSDGTVWAWGRNWDFSLGDGTTTQRTTPVQAGITNVIAVSAGHSSSYAVKSDGTLWGWGNNEGGQLGISTCCWAKQALQKVTGLTGVKAVSTGWYHSLVLKTDGTVWAMGANYDGRLGDGTSTQRLSPVQSGITGVTGISASASGHSLAVKTDGTVWAWGSNSSGELGDGTTTNRYSPVQVSGLTGVKAISAGGWKSSLAVKTDGTVWAWGEGERYSLGYALWGSTDQYTPVSANGLDLLGAVTYKPSGTFTSSIADTGQKSAFTTIDITRTVISGQTVKFKVRSSDNSDMSGSSWPGSYTTYSVSATTIPSSLKGQFVQYMLELSGDTTATPTVDQVKINYTYYPTGDAIADVNTTFLAKFNSSLTADTGTLGTKTATTTGSPEISGLEAKYGKGVYIGNKGGLLGHWKMDGGFTDSLGSNNGTASGNAAATGAAKVGTASVTFDGTGDYVTIGSIGTVKTVEFWINDTNATDGILELIDNATYVSIAGGAITATGFTSPTVYVNGSSASATLAAGWNHVAVTTTTGVSAASMVIGEANNDFMSGLLDDVAVSARVLSPEEVKLKYSTAVHSSPDNGLVGLWHFDGNANDSIGTSNGTGGSSVSYTTPKVGSKSLNIASMSIPLDTRNFTAFTYMAWAKMVTSGTIFTNLSSIWGPGLHIAANGNANFAKIGASWGGTATGCSGMVNGQWGHVTVTFANGTLTSYYNGVPCTVTANTVGTWQATAAGISLNTYAYNTTYFDNGGQTVDEMMIFNKALSSSKVSAVYAGGGTSNSVMTKNSLKYTSASNIPVGSGNPGTIEMWVNPAWAGDDNSSHYLFDMQGADSTTNTISIEKTAANLLRVRIADSASGNYLQKDLAVNNTNFAANIWHHVAGTWDGVSTIELYLDGVSTGVNNNSATAGNAYTGTLPANFYIGTNSFGDNVANAVIDDLRISSKVRTVAEIADTYSSQYYLVSNPTDTNAAAASITDIDWSYSPTLPAGAGAKFMVRTAANQPALASAPWSFAYTLPVGSNSITGQTGRWLQYKAILTSDGADTPSVNTVNVTYTMPSFTITSPAITFTNKVVSNASNAVAITLTPATTIPVGGTLEIAFPSGFNTATASSAFCGVSGSGSGNIFTFSGCTSSVGTTQVTVNLTNVTNTSTASVDIGAFTITSKDGSGVILDQSNYTESPAIKIKGTLALLNPTTQVKNGLEGKSGTTATNNELVGFKLTAAGENVNFTALTVPLAYQGTFADSGYITNFRLYEDSLTIGKFDGSETLIDTVNANPASGQVVFSAFSSSSSVSAGSTKHYLVIFDMQQSLSVGDGVTASIATGNFTAAGLTTSLAITASGDVTNEPTNATTGDVSLLASTPVSQSLLSDGGTISTNNELVSFKLTANAWEAINFTGLSIPLTYSGMTDGDVTNVSLYKDLGTVGTFDLGIDSLLKVGSLSSGTLSITGYSDSISAGGTNNYIVVFDMNTSAVGGETIQATVATTGITSVGATSAVGISATGSDVTGITHKVTGTMLLGNPTAQTVNSLVGDGGILSYDNELVAFKLTSGGEQMDVTQVVIDLTGVNSTKAINFDLVYDVDGDGLFDYTDANSNLRYDAGDTALDTIVKEAVSLTAGTVTFSGLTTTVGAGLSKNYLVIFDGTTSMTGGDTITASVFAANITVSGSGSVASITATGDVTNEITNTVTGTISLADAPQPVNSIKSLAGIGGTDLSLLAFNFAAVGEAVNVTDLTLSLTYGGGMSAANLSNFDLYADIDSSKSLTGGDLPLKTGVSVSGSSVAFTGITTNNSVSAGSNTNYIVVFDLASSAVGGYTLNGAIAKVGITSAGATSLVGIPLSGVDVSGITHKASGSLAIGASSPLVVNSLLNTAGGSSLNNELIAFKLISTGEALDITQLKVSMAYSGITNTDLMNFKLFEDIGTIGTFDSESVPVKISAGNPSGGVVTFSGFTNSISAGAAKNYLITYTLGTSGVAGETIIPTVSVSNIVATGASSTMAIDALTGANITGPTHTVSGSIVLAIPSTQTANTSLTSLAGIGGIDNTLTGFKLTAQNEAMNITQIVLALNYSGVMNASKVSNFDLYVDTNGNGALDAGETTALKTGVSESGTTLTFASLTNNQISAGSSVNYLIIFDGSSLMQGGDKISASFNSANISASGVSSGMAVISTGDVTNEPNQEATGTFTIAANATYNPAAGVGVYKGQETIIGAFNLTPVGENLTLSSAVLNFSSAGGAVLGTDLTKFHLYKESNASANGWDGLDKQLKAVGVTLASGNVTYTVDQFATLDTSGATTYYITADGSAANLNANEGLSVSIAGAGITALGSGSLDSITSSNTYSGNIIIGPGNIIVAGGVVISGDTTAGGSSTISFAATISNALSSGSKLKIGFPQTNLFDLTGGINVGTTSASASCTGCTVLSNEVIVPVSGALSGSFTVTIIGAKNPSVSGDPGPWQFTTTTSGGNVIDKAINLDGTNITSGSLSTVPAVVFNSLSAGAADFVTVNFTPLNNIPANGKVRIDFPTNIGNVTLGTLFDLSTVSTVTESSANGGSLTAITVTSSSGALQDLLTFTVGTQINGGTPVSFKLTNVKNAGRVGLLNNFTVTTFDSSGVSIDTANTAASISITPGIFVSTPLVSLGSTTSGAVSASTINFKSRNTIPANGTIKLTFPATALKSFGLGSVSVTGVDGGSVSLGTLNSSVSGTYSEVLSITNASQINAGTNMTLTFANLKNPMITGLTGIYKLETQDDSSNIIEQNLSVAQSNINTPNLLASTNVQPASLIISASGNVTTTFTTTNPIPANGKINVIFPPLFTVPTSITLSAATDDGASIAGTLSAAGVTGTRTVTLTNSGIAISGVVSLTFSSITNTTVIAQAGTYKISTTDSGGNLIDQDLAVTADKYKGEFTNIVVSGYGFNGLPSSTHWPIGRTGTIKWQTTDSTAGNAISNVKIVYYTNDDATERVVIASTVDDGATGYDWVPNETTFPILTLASGNPQTDRSDLVHFKIYDLTNASDVNLQAVNTISSPITAFYHKITWNITDKDTGTQLTALTISESGVTNADWAATTDLSSAGGLVHYYPYDTSLSTTWSKTSYLSGSPSPNPWTVDKDKTVSALIQSEALAALSYEVNISASYDDSLDAIKTGVWLTKKGVIQTISDGMPSTGGLAFKVYNSSGQLMDGAGVAAGSGTTDFGAVANLSTATNTYMGVTYDPTAGLDPSETYTLEATVTFKGSPYSTVKQFKIPSQGVYQINMGTSYDSTNDSVRVNAWLTIGGKMVTDPGALSLTLFDNLGTSVATASATTASPSFKNTIYSSVELKPSAGVTANTIYNVRATISYRNNTYTSSEPFSRSDAPTIGEIASQVDTTVGTLLGDQLATQKNAILADFLSKLNSQRTGINSDIKTSVADIVKKEITKETDKITGMETNMKSITDNVVAILEDTSTTLSTEMKSDRATHLSSEILNSEQSVKSGDTLTIRYRTDVGLRPVIDVYNAGNSLLIAGSAMRAVGNRGIYEYVLKVFGSWGLGDFTIVCSESSKGTMDGMVLKVLASGSLETIASDVSKIKGDVDTLLEGGTDSDLDAKLDQIMGQVGLIGRSSSSNDLTSEKLDTLKSDMDKLALDMTKVSQDTDEIKATTEESNLNVNVSTKKLYNTILKMSAELKAIQTDQGVDMTDMLDVAEESADDVEYLTNKMEELKALIEVNQEMLDKSVNKPIVKTWFERN